MLTAPRLGVLALAACIAGCSGKPATGALLVKVNLEPGLISRCVKVTATDGTNSKETRPIVIAAKTSLQVVIYGDGLTQPVTVQALGFTDDACTERAANEASETREGNFVSPVDTVTLTLRANARDGGMDAGTDAGVDAGVDAGTDAGVDAGVDFDQDGYPLPADCNDNDPAINPGVTETSAGCSNGVDDNCNNLVDCQEPACDLITCMGGGRCMVNVCIATTEVVCFDGVDNDTDNLIDCADPDCAVGTACSDSDFCTTGDRCIANGTCQNTMDVLCETPPADAQCHNPVGTCLSDGGANCSYTQRSGTCDDGLACTTTDTCASGSCGGAAVTCPVPGNVCLMPGGACTEPAGACVYTPQATGAGCNDGRNCTINDGCDGDGGCAGTPVSCPTPSQCHTATTGCDPNGSCQFGTRSGLSCDAGTGAGTCNPSFSCIANPASLFPTPPSNFTDTQLPNDGGVIPAASGTRTLNTDTPSITGGGMPPFTVITQGTGTVPALLVRLDGLTISSGQTLIITGSRPLILAVVGNVLIDGTIRALNAGAPTGCGEGGPGGAFMGLGGGGGGGFGTAGAVGGLRTPGGGGAPGVINGFTNLIPVRGGCVGGNGNGTGGTGGAGGGALQITASGSITVTSNGVITAPGQGGQGATGTDASGGGGGSGGAILLEAATINLNSSSWLSANGGSGGGGEDSGNGGPGNPGSETSATPATGGTAQNNAGRGGAGGTRTTAPQAGFPTADNDGAGGGGGAVGRIRLNASTSCVVDPAANRSPVVTSSGAGCP